MINTAATEALQEIIDLERRIALQREAIRKLTVLGWSDAAEKARTHLGLMLLSLPRLRQRAQGIMGLQETPRRPRGAGSEPIETPPRSRPQERKPMEADEALPGAPVEKDDAIEKTRAFFSSYRPAIWADHVAAEEEAVREKIEKLRGARLARNATPPPSAE